MLSRILCVSLYSKTFFMHISQQIKVEQVKFVRNQNKALVLGMWCFKLYMVFFAILLALTVPKSSVKVSSEIVLNK